MNATKFARLLIAVMALLILPAAAYAQGFVTCPKLGDSLLKVPELTRDPTTHRLRAVMKVSDQERMVWFNAQESGGSPFCASQHLRFFQGYSLDHKNEIWPVSATLAEPLPGPTLRARVGDIVQVSFLNEVNLTNFPNSAYFDRAETGQGTGCDETAGIYPKGGTIDDTFPNCFHGSSTANIHYHGTHTTPSSTGDNVLLQIRPTPRNKDGSPVVTEATVREDFKTFFEQCEAHLAHVPAAWPNVWHQLPEGYRKEQKRLFDAYDAGLNPPQKLWPPNQAAIDAGVWPQYYIGAYPYCYQLPEYKAAPKNEDELQMGQSPGTQWYHMHKHGSTTLNVLNTLIGAFIIEGQYDDELKDFYKSTETNKNWGLTQQVLVIQQVGVAPNMERGSNQQTVAQFSVNGRRQPVVTMRQGQTQLWRIVNGAPRSGAFFPAPAGVQWAQIAQDGVQFNVANYQAPSTYTAASASFMMAAGNRVDLLVRVPKSLAPGDYNIQVVDVVKPTELPGGSGAHPLVTLLTVRVPPPDASDPNPEMPFITKEKFPTFPPFLADIDAAKVRLTRELTFNSTGRGAGANHTINDKKFGEVIDQVMLLNAYEEWKIVNTTSDAASPGPIMHPFHIHINPFQIFEVFDPWDPRYVFTASQSKPGTNCYINPDDKSTWHACDLTAIKPPFVWWDVFAMPGGKEVTNAAGTAVVIPGYFRMRSHFVDYTGQYVLHCHILAHEDRGMMELVEVVPNRTVLKHH